MAREAPAPRRDDRFEPRRVREVSSRVGSLLGAARRARADDGLAADDLLIFLAIGHLCLDASEAIPRLVPCTLLELAARLGIPRETVRRKVGRLGDRGLAQTGPGGVVIRDVEAWLRHAAALTETIAATDRASDDATGRMMKVRPVVAKI